MATQKKARTGKQGKISLGRILVPVDFTPASEKSLKYAQSLAKRFGASITMLHVLDFGDLNRTALLKGPLDSSNLYGIAIDECMNKMKVIGDRFLKGCPDWEIKCDVGKTVSMVVEEADELEADLIVVAVHPEHRIRHVICGSTAEQITRNAHCPVLVVREEENDFVTSTL